MMELPFSQGAVIFVLLMCYWAASFDMLITPPTNMFRALIAAIGLSTSTAGMGVMTGRWIYYTLNT